MTHPHPLQSLDSQAEPMSIDDLLSFIDECDVGTSDSEEEDAMDDSSWPKSPPVQSAVHPVGGYRPVERPAEPATTQPKRVRRQRQELLQLRDKVKELEYKLAFVKHGMDVAAASACEDDDTGLAAPFEKSLSVWGRAAERQSKHRTAAEHENAHLKSMLEAQVKLAGNLARILKRTSNIDILQGLHPSSDASRLFNAGNADAGSRASGQEEQMKALQRAYEDTDTAFAAAGMSVSPYQFCDMQVKQNADQSFSIEFRSHHMLGFDAATTSDALWQFMTSGDVSRHFSHIQTTALADDMVTQSFGFQARSEQFQAQFHGTRSMRRFRSAQRTVFVWNSLIEPEGMFNGPRADGGFRLHGCVRMVVQNADSADSSAPCSSVQVLCQLLPESSDVHADLAAAKQHGRVSALIDFLFTVAESFADTTTHMIREVLTTQAQS